MKAQPKKDNGKKKGPTIPAGTEQETGLTRGRTEKPTAPLPGKGIETPAKDTSKGK